MPHAPAFFGLMVFSHGWARILTVMSPQGIGATVEALGSADGVRMETGEGQLPKFVELREGALGRMIEEHDIEVLSRKEWAERKSRLGDVIFS